MPACKLWEVTSKSPGFYVHYYVGSSLRIYERATAAWPLYAGVTANLRGRSLRHIRQLEPVIDITADDLMVVAVPLPDLGAALAAERRMIEHMQPVWNQHWIRGFGSNVSGKERKTQTRPPWSVLHPGRLVGSGIADLDRQALARRVQEYLLRTVPPGAAQSRTDLIRR